MMDDSTTLAAAWRERVAAGDAGPVSVALTGAGHTVRMHGAKLASFHALYKAHAYAETVARKLDQPGEA